MAIGDMWPRVAPFQLQPSRAVLNFLNIPIYTFCTGALRFNRTETPPVEEAHRPVVTYLQFSIQVCFLSNHHVQPATPT